MRRQDRHAYGKGRAASQPGAGDFIALSLLSTDPEPAVVTRFAPSPTGYLHLGHAFSALRAFERARAAGGRFLLRLEDIDPDRCRPAFANAIFDDLAWLGLNWDGDVMFQSRRHALYRAGLESLARRGLLYPCFCSRADILREVSASSGAPHGPDGAPLYPGTCRRLSADECAARLASGAPHAWRLNMHAALEGAEKLFFAEESIGDVLATPKMFGDVVLGRRDAPASYHFCVTHDDAAQGVTLVTRGEDLLPATHLHRLLQHLMGWPVPVYAHHRLVLDSSGRRLSKRDGAATLRAQREAGFSAQEILNQLRQSRF
jgi:glutamyl-Q tRNA(Asp) synthetase